jgi:hypothetical protein
VCGDLRFSSGAKHLPMKIKRHTKKSLNILACTSRITCIRHYFPVERMRVLYHFYHTGKRKSRREEAETQNRRRNSLLGDRECTNLSTLYTQNRNPIAHCWGTKNTSEILRSSQARLASWCMGQTMAVVSIITNVTKKRRCAGPAPTKESQIKRCKPKPDANGST